MQVLLILVGKTSSESVSSLFLDYCNRISKFINFNFVIVPHDNSSNPEIATGKEWSSIERRLISGDYIVLLDERGKTYSSVEFSSFLEKKMVSLSKRLVFIIGGSYGFSQKAYNKASELISLSKMTFPHQLVRVLFAEQLYRGFSIINNLPYHH